MYVNMEKEKEKKEKDKWPRKKERTTQHT